MQQEIGLEIDVDALLASKRAKVGGGGTNTIEVFRANFESFEKLIRFYKTHQNYARESGETAFGEIQKLLTAKGVVSKDGELSHNSIGSYMSQVRAERAKAPRVRVEVDQARPGAKVVKAQEKRVPVAPVIAQTPVEAEQVTDWVSELKRLEAERSRAPWTARDEGMWLELDKKALSMGLTLPRDFMELERAIANDPVRVHCLQKLVNKRP